MRRFILGLSLAVFAVSLWVRSLTAREIDPAVTRTAGLPSSPWRQKEIAEGWKIKSIAPRASLGTAFLAEAERADEGDGWLAASTMPAMVHDVLLQNGKIDAPWLPGRAEKYQWVAEQDWVYAVRFRAASPKVESWL